MPSANALEALAHRLTELETKLAYTEATVDELNEVITGLNQQVQGMHRSNLALNTKLKDISNALPEAQFSAADERPPHY